MRRAIKGHWLFLKCQIMRLHILFLILSGAVPAMPAVAQEDPRAAFFEKKIRPLLLERCYECHSQESDDLGGGLRLDHRQGWEVGGDLGPAIVPGKPDESLFIKAVRRGDDTLQMPPDDQLTRQQIADLETWVAQGAYDPRSGALDARTSSKIDIEEGRLFWAFVPSRLTLLGEPPMQNAALEGFVPEGPIDSMMVRQWSEQGLSPVSQADRRTLLRRLTFDLTGLPPSLEEMETFLGDRSPDALDRVIDRLLASPAYGERWGRHWLGVARYADSNGMDENIAHGNAWRYRDWVVRSFNEDLPYGDFVTAQLAGDLLPASDSQPLMADRKIATGFLSLGPKVLAEVDETKMEMDIIDEQVETVGRAFMGLTMGCARCHDHKFDPIRTDDYYAMAGIFKSTKTMEHFTKIAKWNEVDISTPEQRQQHADATAKVAAKQTEIDALIQAANEDLKSRLAEDKKLPDHPESEYPDEQKSQLATLRSELATLQAAVPELPTAMSVVDEVTPVDLPVHLRGSHLTLGAKVPRGVPEVLVSTSNRVEIGGGASGRLELAQWLVAEEHPLTWRVMTNRIWNWHFGQGLVGSTDNFGKLGESPVNLPLLDWLAQNFASRGGSIKGLHREILTSATYRLGSHSSEANLQRDPENRHLWRAQLRRLDAESIRDSLLLVSGGLDRRMGGSLLHVGNREFLFDHTSKDETNYSSNRRALYLPVIRNHLYDQFALFDYSNASVVQSQRAETTVPSQALFMLNSDLVMEVSRSVVERLEHQAVDFEERGRLLHLWVLGREPTAQEQRLMISLIDPSTQDGSTEDAGAQRRAWQLYAQALLSSNEFLYLR
jgi:hypothetical protein